MKLAFSSVGCPAWDLPTMVEKAKEYGYDGIELRGLQGQMQLPVAPELAADPAKIAELMGQAGVEFVCLASAASFSSRDPRQVAENAAQVREYIDLAAKLKCPCVSVYGGEIPGSKLLGLHWTERRDTVLARIAAAIRDLAPYAAERGVTVVIENGGDFVDSQSMWYLVDAADSPAVRCCWSPFAARTRDERPTRSIPRLGAKIGLVHIGDGKFGDNGTFGGHVPPGQGDVEIARTVQLLRGINYRGYIVVAWPKLWNPALADPEKALPAAAEYLGKLLDEKPVPLTAYKADKFKPRQGHEFAET